MLLRPIPSTFAIVPVRRRRRARTRSDLRHRDARRPTVPKAVRATLRRSLESATSLNGSRRPRSRLLLRQTCRHGEIDDDRRRRFDFDFSANDRGAETVRDAIVAACRSMEDARRRHHEHSPGQHESTSLSDDPLAAADHALTMRTIVKHVAAGFDLDATFMPEAHRGPRRNGLHVDFASRRVPTTRRRSTSSADCSLTRGRHRGLQPDGQFVKRLVRRMGRTHLLRSGRSAARTRSSACRRPRRRRASRCAARSGVQSVSRARRCSSGPPPTASRAARSRARRSPARPTISANANAERGIGMLRAVVARRSTKPTPTRRARRARRSSLPALPRREACRDRALSPCRVHPGTRAVPASLQGACLAP